MAGTALIALLICLGTVGIVWCIDYYRAHRKPSQH